MTIKLESVFTPNESLERISYIKEMIGELMAVARTERADMLVYLLEMSYTEASDIVSRLTLKANLDRYKASHMPVESAREI